MFVAFAVRRAANATTAAGKAIWDGKGLLLVGGATVAAWAFRADLRRLAHRLAHRLFSDDGFSGRLDWGLRYRLFFSSSSSSASSAPFSSSSSPPSVWQGTIRERNHFVQG